MKKIMITCILMLCTSLAIANNQSSSNIASVMNLIALTEQNAPNGVKGTFQFLIKASGIAGGVIYLNTEHDYRDRRNISIELSSNIIEALEKKYGDEPEDFFINKAIEVTGEAKRVTIYFGDKRRRGRKNVSYYFQTHIKVDSMEQIKLL